MNLLTAHRRLLLSLITLALVLSGLWFAMSRPATEPPAILTETIATPEPSDPIGAIEDWVLFPEEEQAPESWLVEPDARDSSNKPAQPAAAKIAAPKHLSAEEKAYRAEFETQLELAFAGDDSQAVELSRFIKSCTAQFASADAVERSIEFTSRRLADGKPVPKHLAGWSGQSINNLEAFEQFQWQTFSRCESSRDLFSGDFWERLRRDADNGNPTARYLYATLQRFPLEAGLRFDQWDEALEHNERIYEYTWRNMNDREPLGILAMAQTLPSNNRSPYSRFSTAAVLTTAAIKCGLQSEQLDQQLDEWVGHIERLQAQYPNAMNQLNEASDEVKRMFCK